MAASKALMASLTHLRPLTCTASVSTSYPTRLVPQPPDLIKWVRKQGGFVHTTVKIAQDESKGLGLMASEEVPRGSDVIVLLHHLPLKFDSLELNHVDELDSVLVNLARHVP